MQNLRGLDELALIIGLQYHEILEGLLSTIKSVPNVVVMSLAFFRILRLGK